MLAPHSFGLAVATRIRVCCKSLLISEVTRRFSGYANWLQIPRFPAIPEDAAEKLAERRGEGEAEGCCVRVALFNLLYEGPSFRGTKGISVFYRVVMKCEPANYSNTKVRRASSSFLLSFYPVFLLLPNNSTRSRIDIFHPHHPT